MVRSSWPRWQTANRTSMTNTYCVYIVLRYSWWWTVDLSETCRVLYQINLGQLCISLAFIGRIYHDARSPECQIQRRSVFTARYGLNVYMQFRLILVLKCLILFRKRLSFRAKSTIWASPSWPTVYPSVSTIQTTLLISMPLDGTVVLSKQIKALLTKVWNSTYYCSALQSHCCLFLGG